MTLPVLILDWHRCPDGVEVVDIPPRAAAKGTIYEAVGGPHFCLRSNRREHFRRASDLTDPVVLRFINAATEDKLIKFFGFFGLPDGWDKTSTEVEIEQRGILAVKLEEAASGEAGLSGPVIAGLLKDIRLRPAFDHLGDGQSARLTLRAGSLRQFMIMEIVQAAVVGARVSRCQHCSEVFLTGPMTDRRSSAKFCKDLCRQRSLRRRKKEEGGNGDVSSET